MSKYVKLTAGLSNSQTHQFQTDSAIYVYLEAQAAKVDTPESRKPLNVNLVIDRSGSMRGDKLAYAKQALAFIVQHLQSDDRLSLVQYDDEVNVLAANREAADKASLFRLIDQIEVGGMTNLSGGMMEGIEQAKQGREANRISRVFLLSDGLANRGVKDPRQIGLTAQQAYRETGISLSTFGVGNDYDENLMITLAEYGGGTANFIGLPDEIPNVFAEELQDLLAVVAQNAKLELSYPADLLRFDRHYGHPVQDEVGKVTIALHDLFSEDRKGALLRFLPKQALTEPLRLQATLTFDEVLGSLQRETLQQPLALTPVPNSQDLSATVNHQILQQVAFYQANESQQKIIHLLERREYAVAKQMAQQQIEFLQTQLQQYPDAQDLKAQLAAIQEIYQEVDRLQAMTLEMQRSSHKHYKSRSSYVRSKKMDKLAYREQMRRRELGEDDAYH